MHYSTFLPGIDQEPTLAAPIVPATILLFKKD